MVQVITANARLTSIADTKLILVLPASTASDFPTVDFFDQANIQILFGEAGELESSEGESLEEVLSSIL